jgi:hypothetical protein
MARVIWDDAGERLYQVGVDRGMLYMDPVTAVPWSGLVSMTESPSGGDAQLFYLDGVAILNTPLGEDFAASLEAFSAPPEFAPCAGRGRLSAGLYAGEQPKASFNFSYRTLIGNDIVGTSFAYKIHLVYNAMAQVTDFQHSTDASAASIKTQSWGLTTTPEAPAGYRPTSHFIFDTTKVDPAAIARLEDILYGDVDNDPRMPTADEVVGLLTEQTFGVWFDLTGLPDFPVEANPGDVGVDFSNDDLYADQVADPDSFWWDLTGGADFPAEAKTGDWGYDTVTGEVWRNA